MIYINNIYIYIHTYIHDFSSIFILWIFNKFYNFLWIFIDFHSFLLMSVEILNVH